MSLPPSDARIGQLIDERYRLLEQIATGGMGVIYRAERVGIAKTVAIKFLHESVAGVPDIIKRFQREAEVLSRLSHPNIVSVIDYGVWGNAPYLVMEFCSGWPLSSLLQVGPMPAPRVAKITRQILAALRHAHTSGIIHRDLKPENVLMLAGLDDDFIKILDFGLAKLTANDESEPTQLTKMGFALGTPGYMSPEQAQGGPIDARTDLYSLGAMMYTMVVGRKPFIADSPAMVLQMHLDIPPKPPRKAGSTATCSVEFERVILRALEKPTAKRFQSAADFQAALEETPEGCMSVAAIEVARSASSLSALGQAATTPRLQAADTVPETERPVTALDTPPPIAVAPVAPVPRPSRVGATRPTPSVESRPRSTLARVVLWGVVGSAIALGIWIGRRSVEVGGDSLDGASRRSTKRMRSVFVDPNGSPHDPPPVPGTAAPAQALEETADPKALDQMGQAQVGAGGLEGSPQASVQPAAGPGAVAALPGMDAGPGAREDARLDNGSVAAAHLNEADEDDDTDEEPVVPEDTPGAVLEKQAASEELSAAQANGQATDPARGAEANSPSASVEGQGGAAQVPGSAQLPGPAVPPADPAPGGSAAAVSATAAAKAPPTTRKAHTALRKDRAKPQYSLSQAQRLLAGNRVDKAIMALYAVRRRTPKSAQVALMLGHAYFRKNWRTDGLREYAQALALNHRLKSNGTLLKNVVLALDDPTYRLARSVIRKRIGKSAASALRRAARSKNALIKARSSKLLQQLRR